jgi:hypothetical protein
MCWHKWTKWEQIDLPIVKWMKDEKIHQGIMRVQRRKCENCGKIQEEEITQ